MRILHVTDGYRPRVGGIEIFVQDLARRQAEAGHDVSVLTATAAGGVS
jgi:glycogen synthase